MELTQSSPTTQPSLQSSSAHALHCDTSPAMSIAEVPSAPGMSAIRSRSSAAILAADLPSNTTKAAVRQFHWPERGSGRNPYFNPWTVQQRKGRKKAGEKTLTAAYYFNRIVMVGVRYRSNRVRASFVHRRSHKLTADVCGNEPAGPPHRNNIWACETKPLGRRRS